MQGTGPSSHYQDMIRGILRYLIEYPDAKDTIEGILKWWLPRYGSEHAEEEIQDVLDFLESRGWLITGKTIPSKKIYSMNKERLEEIRAFLNDLQNKG